MTDLSLKQMADLLGVSLSSAQRLVSEQLIVRSSRGKFDMEKSLHRYCDHLRSVASNKSETESAKAAIRMKLATAELQETKSRQLSKELFPVAEARDMLLNATRVWKAAFLQIPQRFRVKMRMTVAQEQQMEELIDDRLEELAEEIKALGQDDAPRPRPRLNRRSAIPQAEETA